MQWNDGHNDDNINDDWIMSRMMVTMMIDKMNIDILQQKYHKALGYFKVPWKIIMYSLPLKYAVG